LHQEKKYLNQENYSEGKELKVVIF